MNKTTIGIFILLISVFISSVSQILLKKSTQRGHKSIIKEYLNPPVAFAYTLFISSTFLTMLAYRDVSLSLGTILESTGYFWVAILGLVFLKEPIRKQKWIGLGFIFLGILVFNC